MMKKGTRIAGVLALLCVFSISGCGNQTVEEQSSTEEVTTVAATTIATTAPPVATKKKTEPPMTTTFETTETTTTHAPQPNTTEMVDKLSNDAKAAAATATPEDLQKALKNIRNYNDFFINNDTMQYAMYNSQLLYYYYENTNTCYEQAGFYAFTAIKYVYRGIDTVDGNDTVTNLQKLQEALAQCTDIVATPDTEVPAAPVEPATEAVQSVSYKEGMYKVGTDIPAGEYCLYADPDDSGYYSVNADSNGDTIIGNHIFDYNAFVTVSDGQYFKISDAIAVPVSLIDGITYQIDTSKSGMFRIGIDLPAGEYRLNSLPDDSGYYCIYGNSLPDADIVANHIFEGQSYVTVTDGQYLVLSDCMIVQ